MNAAMLYCTSREITTNVDMSEDKYGVAEDRIQAKKKIDIPGPSCDRGHSMLLQTAEEKIQ